MREFGSLFRNQYRYRWSASVLLVFLLDFCTYMAFRDAGSASPFPYQDKVNHLLAFFTLFTIGHISLHFDFFPGRRLGVLTQIGHGTLWLIYGLLIELGQHFFAARDASWVDLAFDGLGILIGIVFVVSTDLRPRSPEHD